MDAAVRLDLMLHACMLAQTGIPMLYSGDEIGQVNDYTYKEDPDKAPDSRYIHRGRFLWELAEKRRDASSVPGRIFQGLDRLERIRRKEGIFNASANVYTYDVHDDSILCIMREKDGEKFFGIFNFSDDGRTAWMQENGKYMDLMTGEEMTVKDIFVPGHDFYWIKSVTVQP